MNIAMRDALAYTGTGVGILLLAVSNIATPVTLILTLAAGVSLFLAGDHDYFRNIVVAAGVLGFLHAATLFFDVTVFLLPSFMESVTLQNMLSVFGDVSAFSDAVATPLEAIGGFLTAFGAVFLRPRDAEPRIAYASLPVVFAALLIVFTGNLVFGVSLLVLTVFLQQGRVFRFAVYAFTVIGLALDGIELYAVLTQQQLYPPVFIEQAGFLVYQLPVTVASMIGYVLLPFAVWFYDKRWRSKEELEEEVLQQAEEEVFWEEETAWDKVKTYYRQNPRASRIMAVSIVVGILLISVTSFYYFSIQDVYTQNIEATPAEDMRIALNDPYTTEFVMENPGELEEATLTIRFRDIDDGTVLHISFNGERLDTVDGQTPGGSEVYTVEQGQLQRVNQIEIAMAREQTEESGDLGAVTTLQTVQMKATTSGQDIAFYTLTFIGMLGFLLPLLYLRYSTYQERKELEDRFPDFLRDVVSGTRAGMSLTRSIKNVKDHDYGKLTPYVQKMAAQIEWGLSFEEIMERFADETNSRIIQRAVSTINQSYRSGGSIYQVLEAVSDNIEEVKKLQRERSSELYGSMVSGYIIYGVFLVVLSVLANYLIPSLVFEFDIPGSGGGGIENPEQIFSIFRGLIIIQAIFSGLVIGKLGEGDIKAGAKHVGILLIVGYAAAVIFI